MRLRWATIKNGPQKHCFEFGRTILRSLPDGAMGYNFEAWPRIRILYVDDLDKQQAA